MIKKVMGKRGDLREQVPGLLIGILCLVLIVIFAVALYKIFINQEAENAKRTIDSLEGKIKLLENGQSNEFLITGFKNADNWFVAGWGKNDPTAPDKCMYRSCLCICRPSPGYFMIGFEAPEEPSRAGRNNLLVGDKTIIRDICQKEGICRYLDVDGLEVVTKVIIPSKDGPPFEVKFFVLETNAIAPKISKVDGKIKIENEIDLS